MATGSSLLDAHKVLALPIRFDTAVTSTERRQVRAALKQGRFSLNFANDLRGGILTTQHATFRPALQELSNASGQSRRWCVAVVDVPTHGDLMVQPTNDRSVVKVASIAQHLVILRAWSAAREAAAPSSTATAATAAVASSTSGLLTRVTRNIAQYWNAINNLQTPIEAKVHEMESWIKRFKDHKLYDEAFEIMYAPAPPSVAAAAAASSMSDNVPSSGNEEEILVWRWRELTPEGQWKEQRTEIRTPLQIACVRNDLRTNQYTFITKTGKRVGQIGVTVHGKFSRYERGNGSKNARSASARVIVAPASNEGTSHPLPPPCGAPATTHPLATATDDLTADIDMSMEQEPATSTTLQQERQELQRQQSERRRSQRQSKRLRVSYVDNSSGTDSDGDDDDDQDEDDRDGGGDEDDAGSGDDSAGAREDD
jgi:hypothetical protein